MKRLFMGLALAALLAGCVSPSISVEQSRAEYQFYSPYAAAKVVEVEADGNCGSLDATLKMDKAALEVHAECSGAGKAKLYDVFVYEDGKFISRGAGFGMPGGICSTLHVLGFLSPDGIFCISKSPPEFTTFDADSATLYFNPSNGPVDSQCEGTEQGEVRKHEGRWYYKIQGGCIPYVGDSGSPVIGSDGTATVFMGLELISPSCGDTEQTLMFPNLYSSPGDQADIRAYDCNNLEITADGCDIRNLEACPQEFWMRIEIGGVGVKNWESVP